MASAFVPLAIYVISALLMYLETCMIASALEHIRHRPHTFKQTVTVYCLLMPLLLMPVVPVILLVTLDRSGQASGSSLFYAGLVWLIGLMAALPAYWYATRKPTRRRFQAE